MSTIILEQSRNNSLVYTFRNKNTTGNRNKIRNTFRRVKVNKQHVCLEVKNIYEKATNRKRYSKHVDSVIIYDAPDKFALSCSIVINEGVVCLRFHQICFFVLATTQRRKLDFPMM